MAQVSFDMSDVQHKEWFIATLVPNIQKPLMQQKIVTQRDALEIAMKLEASTVGENAVGMNQMQEIKKGKENHEDIWCTCCRADGHTKDTCPDFQNYLL